MTSRRRSFASVLALAGLLAAPALLPAQGGPPPKKGGPCEIVPVREGASTAARDDLGAQGREALLAQGNEVGCDNSPERRAQMRRILATLQDVSGQRDLTLSFLVIASDENNAFALPGGYVGVYLGQFRFADSVAAVDAKGDRAKYDQLRDTYIAVVLSHELSHVTLGHTTDSVAVSCRQKMQGAIAEQRGAQTDAERETMIKQVAAQCMRYSQQRELDADANGAVYLLAANRRGKPWTVGDAITYWGHEDRWARTSKTFYDPRLTRLLSTHPRGATRIASLNRLLARLQEHQARFDDALALIYANMQLDVATALLDSVLTDLPDLVAARQAKAAAGMRRWLNTVPIQALQVRASVVAMEARFIEGMKGATMGDTRLLSRARADFTAIPGYDAQPATLSDLAILDAYADDLAQAEQRARRAVSMQPGDPDLHNNLGVVLFLAGKYPEAKREFVTAIAGDAAAATPEQVFHACGESDRALRVLPACFNYGRTLRELKDADANRFLAAYAKLDEVSDWSREAARLAGVADAGAGAPGAGEAPQPPGRPAAAPDGRAVAGVVSNAAGQQLALGMSISQAAAVLGNPDEAGALPNGKKVLRYRGAGVALVVANGTVVLVGIQAGSSFRFDGVGPGDPVSATGKWGAPSNDGSEPGRYLFNVGRLVVAVAAESGTITTVLVTARDGE